MIAPRVSIGRMMLMIMPVAVGCAALCRPTRLGASLTFAAAFAILIVKTLGAMFGEVERRPARSGFAIAGWLCLIWHFSFLFSFPSGEIGSLNSPVIFVLEILHQRLFPSANSLNNPPGRKSVRSINVPINGTNGDAEEPAAEPPEPTVWQQWTERDPSVFTSFVSIGYSLASLVAAVTGGLVANYYAAKRLMAWPEGKPT